MLSVFLLLIPVVRDIRQTQKSDYMTKRSFSSCMAKDRLFFCSIQCAFLLLKAETCVCSYVLFKWIWNMISKQVKHWLLPKVNHTDPRWRPFPESFKYPLFWCVPAWKDQTGQNKITMKAQMKLFNIAWQDTLSYKICAVKRITKTCLYYFDPLKPHFYIVKLGFTGVYIIFLISAQKHRLWVLVIFLTPPPLKPHFYIENWCLQGYTFFLILCSKI